MKTKQHTIPRLNLFVIGLMLLTLIAGLSVRPAAAENAPQWQELNINITASDYNSHTCFDPLQPGKLLTGNPNYVQPSYSIDLATGQKTQLNSLSFYRCNEATGLLYAKVEEGDVTGIVFSSADPAGKPIAHAPDDFAEDGSLWVYAAEADTQKKIHFYASPDGGLTWQERNITGLFGQLQYTSVANGDGRIVYALTGDYQSYGRRFTLYVSRDAGVSWEKRYEESSVGNDSVFSPYLYFGTQLARSSGADYVVLERSVGAGSNGTRTTLISNDGGKTFNEAWVNGRNGAYEFWYSDRRLVRLGTNTFTYSMQSSVDGGKTWQPLDMPFTQEPYNPGYSIPRIQMYQVNNAPNNLFLSYADSTKGDLWYSPDGARTWQKISANMPNLLASSYTPTSLLSFKDNKIFRLDLPSVDKSQTEDASTSNASDATYFGETRHNLSGIFKKYWTDHGGLAQFGYPHTEPFREVNPADGKVYMVQYFERNRFEYHPEFAGTQYEVLLGLLGNQQTDFYRANKHGAFNYFADAHYPGGTYFPQTGHNLRNSFKSYWEANGGLSLYGFPISEEFEEVNPDDGKTYVVQYFERNRFEYHPENKGTKYEVLLGLLGNTLLKSKGWL